MPLPLTQPPQSLCLLRLSAIGDISHTLPVVRTLQQAWPKTHLTWIIGKTEYALVGDIPGIEFIVFDKARGWHAYREIARQLRGRRFDILLHMQMSLRASLLSLLVKAPIKLGFDRVRAKDLQWLFTNHKIAARQNEHVLDSLFGFTEALGITERRLCWDIPIPAEAETFAREQTPTTPYLVISPCSSMRYRNWHSWGYAEVAIHAIRQHDMAVVLCGGHTALERQYAAEIAASIDAAGLSAKLTNLVSRTNLKQLVAVLQHARLLISPDAGPAHLATAVGTPVIGLYACTNPERARPYLSESLLVNRYPDAVQRYLGKEIKALPWGGRVKQAEAMSLIQPADVIAMLDRALAACQDDN